MTAGSAGESVAITEETFCCLDNQFRDGAVFHQGLHLQAFMKVRRDIGGETAIALPGSALSRGFA